MMNLKLKLSTLSFQAAWLVVIALFLGGCFTSKMPLIMPDSADYPFQSITFYVVDDAAGEDPAKRITLLRQGDVYVEALKEDEGQYLFTKIAENLFIAQISQAKNDGEIELIYGIVQVRNDTDFVVLSPVCENVPEDLLGRTGIVKIEQKYMDECRISSLDQLEELARLLIGSEVERDIYRIVELVR